MTEQLSNQLTNGSPFTNPDRQSEKFNLEHKQDLIKFGLKLFHERIARFDIPVEEAQQGFIMKFFQNLETYKSKEAWFQFKHQEDPEFPEWLDRCIARVALAISKGKIDFDPEELTPRLANFTQEPAVAAHEMSYLVDNLIIAYCEQFTIPIPEEIALDLEENQWLDSAHLHSLATYADILLLLGLSIEVVQNSPETLMYLTLFLLFLSLGTTYFSAASFAQTPTEMRARQAERELRK